MKNFLQALIVACVALVITLAVVELIAVAGFWIHDGRYLPVSEIMRRDGNIYLEDRNEFVRDREKQGLSPGTDMINPYLGYTKHSLPPAGRPVNRSGLESPDFPLERQDGVFTIMITGGSVANAFYKDGTSLRLEDELNRHYTNEKIRQFVVVNGAVDGWHEPQQSILLMQYAQGIDGFINLFGWNEQSGALMQKTFPSRLEQPPNEFYVALDSYYGNSSAIFLYQWDAALKRLQHQSGALRHSKAVYFLTQHLRNFFRHWAVHEKWSSNKEAGNFLRSQFRLPEDWPVEKRSAFILSSLKKYIYLEHHTGLSMNFKTLFLIQPCVMIGKEPAPEEKESVARGLPRKDGYQKLAAEVLTLKKENVAVFSLLDIFKNHPEKLYKDSIHLYPEGNKILKDQMLRLIEQEWNLPRTK